MECRFTPPANKPSGFGVRMVPASSSKVVTIVRDIFAGRKNAPEFLVMNQELKNANAGAKMLNPLFRNLASNAVKFTNPGGMEANYRLGALVVKASKFNFNVAGK